MSDRRILLIGGILALGQDISANLNKLGFQIWEAANSQEALKMLDQK